MNYLSLKKQQKILNRSRLKELVYFLNEKNQKIVFTNGCFDLIHIGHIRYLKKAKCLGDVLIVGLNSDTSVRRLKGEKRPIISQLERAEILSSLYFVDYVIIFEEDTPANLLEVIKPDYLVKGGDYKIKDIVGKKFVESYGGKVKTIKVNMNTSTTNIISKIKE